MSPEPSAPGAPGAPGAPTLAPHGEDVIHNIGYRTYEGPRLGRAYARRSLFTQSLRGAYGLGRTAKSKVLPMLLLAAMCGPAAIIVAVAVVTGADELVVHYSEYAIQLQPVIGIFVAAVAPQTVSLDLRFKTIPLYFSRPIERIDYVTAKAAALATALFVFTAAPVVILYAGSLLAELGFADQTRGVVQGLLFSALFSLVYAGIGLVIAALTPRRGFGVAAVIAVLTIPYMLISALQAIAFEQGDTGVVGWLGLGSPGTLLAGAQEKFFGGGSAFPGGHELTGTEGPVYLLLCAGLIAGSYGLLLRRYRKAGL